MIDWLNTNAGGVQGIAVVILVIVTAYYAWQTRQLAQQTNRMVEAAREQARTAASSVKEMERQRMEAQRPILDISIGTLRGTGMVYEALQMDRGMLPGIMRANLKNIGSGPAIDIEAGATHASRTFGQIYRNAASEFSKPDFSSLEAHSEASFSIIDPQDEGRGEASPETPAFFWSEYSDVYGNRWRSERPYFFNQSADARGEMNPGKLHVKLMREGHL